jgi:hypothetical protein
MVRPSAEGAHLVVKSEVATTQLESERKPVGPKVDVGDEGGATTGGEGSSSGTGVGPRPAGGERRDPPRIELRRFHGAANLDPLRLGRDASQIAEEIVQHLTRINGANVEITIEIQAELPEPASDKLVRDVTENCRTLRFTSYGFEQL